MFSPLFPDHNQISTLEEWTVRVAPVVIVASRVESLFGNAHAALDREEREVEFWFQMVDLGGGTAHFCFATRMVMVRVQVGA